MQTNGYTFNTLANWKRTLRTYPYLQPKYIPKLVYLSGVGIVTAPVQWNERRRYYDMVQNTELHEEPIFIMGFWRSGTTHLHNLLVQDEEYGYVSTLQGLMPGAIISSGKQLRPLMELLFPKTRPMDNVAIRPHAPQESDIALMNFSLHTYYHYVLFPTQLCPLFDKYILMDSITPTEMEEWRNDYLYILRTATYLNDGRPLMIKNPPHIGHVEQVIDMFPKARYIEIRRDPLAIWISYMHLHRTTIPTHNVQDFSWETLEEDALCVFEKTMRRWLEKREMIPEQSRVIIRYEALVASPVETMRHIYDTFGLSSERMLPRWQAYIESISGYQKNGLSPKATDIQYMRERMAFLYEAWDYPLPEGENN